jgi:hypothetical protein
MIGFPMDGAVWRLCGLNMLVFGLGEVRIKKIEIEQQVIP